MRLKQLLHTAFSIVVLLALFSNHKSVAQQDPGFSQYMYNTLSVNPAYTGTVDGVSFLLLSRHQWIGFDGAPQTHTFSVHSPIDKNYIGLGLSYAKDKIGPINSDDANLNYSFKITPHQGATLSFGLNTGISGRRIDFSAIEPLFDNDPTFNTGKPSLWTVTFGAGIYYHTQNYYVGFSVPKLRSHNLSDGFSKDLIIQERHWYLKGGYVYDLDDVWKLKPSILTKYVEGSPMSVVVNFNAMFNETIVGGVSYRAGNSFGIMTQIRIFDNLWFGYAFDFSVNPLKNHNNGTHEVLLLFDLLRPEEVTSPRFF